MKTNFPFLPTEPTPAPRIFHGEISPSQLGRALVGEFNRGNLHAQQIGTVDQVMVQIVTRRPSTTGGETALTVQIQKVADGIAVQLGRQSWLGVAASLGMTALSAWRNPWNLLSRLDDIAQDVENLSLVENVWEVIEQTARAAGASQELSQRLRRIVCSYCQAANPVGESVCVACGAPLGDAQPRTCRFCGFVVRKGENICPNCGKRLRAR
jgi:hypothetical protein